MLNIRLTCQTHKIKSVIFILSAIMFLNCSSSNNDDDPVTLAITSGRVNTRNKFSFTHGRIDVSAKLPKTTNGLWPAIWLLGDDQTKGWPACGEIDIMEMGSSMGISSGTQDRNITSGCHWGEVVSGGGHPAYARNDNHTQSLQDDKFHLFTLTWDETRIRIYIDPELDSNNNIVNPNSFFYEILIDVYTGDFPVGNYFHKPFHIVLNLAAGGEYTGIYDINKVTALNTSNNNEAKMYIDYVKVYEGINTDNLKWQDLFDGESLDSGKWNIEVNNDGGGNNELQLYRSQNVSLGVEPVTGNKCLVLTAKKEEV